MKILFKNMGFGGGAPKSLLEYVKLAQKEKLETVVLGQFTYLPKDYHKYNIKLIDIPYFELSKPLNSFILLIRYLKVIKDEKPNLIHCITSVNSIFHTIIEDVIKVPILYNIPGGKIDKVTANMLNGKKIIVFSNENRQELLKYKYRQKDIYKFSNRIDFEKMQELKKKYRKTKKTRNIENLNFLITSRINSSKVQSIKHLINIADRLNNDNYNVTLHILGDGDLYGVIEEIAQKVNNEHGKKIIRLHGYKSNVHEYILNSDIVFGKGRSVIDGIILKKPAFVVDEDYHIIECDIENFENLSDNNFTGRNYDSKYTSYYELEKKLDTLNSQTKLQRLDELYLLIKKKYDISVIEQNILELYRENLSKETNYSYSILNLIFKYIKFYLKVSYYYFLN